MNEEHKRQIGQALGQIPSGVSVLTARHGPQSTGMLTSWVQQAGFEPPAVTVAVKRGRPIESMIEASGHFVINLVGENRGPMFKHFSKGFSPDEPAFEGLAIQSLPEGVVIEDCIAHLRCRLVGSVDSGDHRVYVGEVLGGDVSGEGKPYVHLRANGLRY
jgi:flavin reductase (DIM6/NTAB) family NADH-FMN oxidoreductase RutF